MEVHSSLSCSSELNREEISHMGRGARTVRLLVSTRLCLTFNVVDRLVHIGIDTNSVLRLGFSIPYSHVVSGSKCRIIYPAAYLAGEHEQSLPRSDLTVCRTETITGPAESWIINQLEISCGCSGRTMQRNLRKMDLFWHSWGRRRRQLTRGKNPRFFQNYESRRPKNGPKRIRRNTDCRDAKPQLIR